MGLVEERPQADLAATAAAVAADWGLVLGSPFLATHSYVVPADATAVLKVVPPEDDESNGEAPALALWNGRGAVRLLRSDPQRNALLLERLVPGHDLGALSEPEALAVAVEIGRSLWRKPPEGPSFRNVLAQSRQSLAALKYTEHELLRDAEARLDAIKIRTETLVHGDLHHHNILRRGSGWAAIDPKPAIGEPEYDIAPFLWNPIGFDPTPDSTMKRIDAFAAAGLEPERIRAWAIVRGTILGLPLDGDHHAAQLKVVRMLM